jgi:hypothetical protein
MAVGLWRREPFRIFHFIQSEKGAILPKERRAGTPAAGASSPGRQPHPAYRCFAIAKTETTAPGAAFAQSSFSPGW